MGERGGGAEVGKEMPSLEKAHKPRCKRLLHLSRGKRFFGLLCRKGERDTLHGFRERVLLYR